jgi:hypothetical protein
MIVKNNAKRAYFYEGEAILPGSNNVAKDIDQNHPVIKALLESGELEIVEDDKLDADAAIKAINAANTVEAVEGIAKKVDDKKVKAAASKRKKEIEAALEEIAAAGKKKETEDEEKDDD